MQAYTTYILSTSSSYRHRNIYSSFLVFFNLTYLSIYNVDYFSPLICGTDNLDIELPNFYSDEPKAGVLRRKCNRMIISIGVHSEIFKMYHLEKKQWSIMHCGTLSIFVVSWVKSYTPVIWYV